MWFFGCLALSGSIAVGAALPISVATASLGEPFQDLSDYLHSIISIALFIAFIFTIPIMLVLGMAVVPVLIGNEKERSAENRRIENNLMIGMILWIGIPFLLGGTHLACWILEPSTRNPAFGWTGATPSSDDYRNAWFLLHGMAIVGAVGLWSVTRLLRRFQRFDDVFESCCQSCGYPLDGLQGRVCPECGTAMQEPNPSPTACQR